jgi:DHA1 family tetracycline resistance protein-like MFS transporter
MTLICRDLKPSSRIPLVVLFVTIFLGVMGFGLIIPILPSLTISLGASEAALGLIAAIYSLMNLIFSPYWGKWSDRAGRRPVLLTSILITSMGYLIFAHSTSIWILIVARVFAGLGSANISAAQAYIADVTSPDKRAKTMGLIIGVAFSLGFVSGPFIGGIIFESYGLLTLGYTAAGISATNLLAAYFLLPESLKPENRSAQLETPPFVKNILQNFSRKHLKSLYSINFIFIAAFSMMQVTAVLLWEERSGLTSREVGMLFSYIGVCGAIAGASAGVFNRMLGERNMLVVGSILMALGLASMPYTQGELLVPYHYIILAVISLANGLISPALLSLISQHAKMGEVGNVTGVGQSFNAMGRVVGPALGGALYGFRFDLPYIFGGILLLGAMAIAVFYRKSVLLDSEIS